LEIVEHLYSPGLQMLYSKQLVR